MAVPCKSRRFSAPGISRPLAWFAVGATALALAGCGAIPGLRSAANNPELPLPPGIEVVFNHRIDHRYRSPINGQWRQGDDLEAFVIRAIREARQEVVVAVQELSLPAIAEALVAQQRRGVRVRVVLENTYSTPWSLLHPADLEPHQRHRVEQLRALGLGDAVAILQRGRVPLIDDTADGSAGSGLMHHLNRPIALQWIWWDYSTFTPPQKRSPVCARSPLAEARGG